MKIIIIIIIKGKVFNLLFYFFFFIIYELRFILQIIYIYYLHKINIAYIIYKSIKSL